MIKIMKIIITMIIIIVIILLLIIMMMMTIRIISIINWLVLISYNNFIEREYAFEIWIFQIVERAPCSCQRD